MESSRTSLNGDVRGDTKELRLALVCYGGVSLAIYMHGVTKEIHKLVIASQAFVQDPERNPFPAGQTEHAYWEALNELSGREGVRTSVIVDVISGTSAGGINGIYLAKALAHDLSQDALRDLWMSRGDIAQLIDVPERLPRSLKLPWFLFQAVLRLRGLKMRSPLRSDRMCKWLFEALQAMDAAPRDPSLIDGRKASLLPGDHLLELFVTATDFYGYARSIPITTTYEGEGKVRTPRVVADQWHRHVLKFRYHSQEGVDHFSDSSKDNAGLAFAARATSSFPGAFPPISVAGFRQQLRDTTGVDCQELEKELFRVYELADLKPDEAHFVDGGVLDNFPFLHSIEAIRKKTADRQVDRRLVYVQPDPGAAPQRAPTKEPGLLRNVWGAMSSIPRKEPVVDDLLRVQNVNDRVRRLREVIETSFDDVSGHVAEIVDLRQAFSLPISTERLSGWEEEMHEKSRRWAGFGYGTYLRLKIHSVVDTFADAVSGICDFPHESNHSLFVKGLAHEWAQDQGLFERKGSPTGEQEAFLRSFDLRYKERRVRFLIHGINWLYQEPDEDGRKSLPPREKLDMAKAALYQSVAKLARLISGAGIGGELRQAVRSSFSDRRVRESWVRHGWAGKEALAEYKTELDALQKTLREGLGDELAGFGPNLYSTFLEVTDGWEEDLRKDLLVRYLGFPFWDVLVYPLYLLGEVAERDAVEVYRISPDDATLLEEGGVRAKVKGAALGHFAAFFKRAWRENDYLWGRLDGVELLMRMLLGEDPSPRYRQAFEAVLKEEREALPNSKEGFERIEGLIAERLGVAR